MFCPSCGAENPEEGSYCANCGQPLSKRPAVGAGRAAPPTYLVPAILVTVFCCLPFGIPAIVYAAQVDGKFKAGDAAGAEASSRKAKNWMIASFGVTLLVVAFYALMLLIGSVVGG